MQTFSGRAVCLAGVAQQAVGMSQRDSKEAYNKYMRENHLSRYYKIRQKAIKSLGGECVKCGATNALQFDHIDPKTKKFPVGQILNVSLSKFQTELKKCQLLCQPCHTRKSTIERGQTPAKGTHGTLSAYRYCGPPKCAKCLKAKREQNRRLRAKWKQQGKKR